VALAVAAVATVVELGAVIMSVTEREKVFEGELQRISVVDDPDEPMSLSWEAEWAPQSGISAMEDSTEDLADLVAAIEPFPLGDSRRG
jgi:hypothetical protein